MKKIKNDKNNDIIYGRPTKLTNSFVEAATEVLFTKQNALIFTDSELLFQINELLPEKEKITDRTFKNWKANSIKENCNDEKANIFFPLYQKALQIQKDNIFNKLQDESQSGMWQKWAWIIERKFTEWNLRHIGEVDHTSKGEKLSAGVIVMPAREINNNNSDALATQENSESMENTQCRQIPTM